MIRYVDDLRWKHRHLHRNCVLGEEQCETTQQCVTSVFCPLSTDGGLVSLRVEADMWVRVEAMANQHCNYPPPTDRHTRGTPPRFLSHMTSTPSTHLHKEERIKRPSQGTRTSRQTTNGLQSREEENDAREEEKTSHDTFCTSLVLLWHALHLLHHTRRIPASPHRPARPLQTRMHPRTPLVLLDHQTTSMHGSQPRG